MSSKPEPVIWSCDTGQQIPYFDSCHFTITWMSNIKDVPMVMVLFSYLSSYWTWRVDVQTDIHTYTHVRTYAPSYDNQNFLD